MTDATAKAPLRVTSRDYWDIVIAQLKRRKTVWASAIVLVALYASAIYAPFIANDRPLYFHGVDTSEYKKSLREMKLGASALVEDVRESSGDVSVAKLESERDAIAFRLARLRRQLGPADREMPDQLAIALERVVREVQQNGKAAAVPVAAEIASLVARMDRELSPTPPGEPAVPGQSVALVPFTAWPVFENLARGEIFFMALWALVMLFPVVNRVINGALLGGDRLRIRRARRWKLLLFVLIPMVAALAWQGKKSEFFITTFKSGLTNGSVVAERVVFPLIPYGIAESSDSETFRPPTWHAESQISEDGFYETGPRAGRFDPTTRIPRLANPIPIRVSERDRNDPLRHALGTDSLGRDLMARVIWGGRVSLAVGIVSTVLLVFIGVIIGSIAGYYGGWVDTVLSRLIEIVQTFPVFFLILIIVAFVGPSIMNIMLVIGLVRWTGVARLVRGEFIRLRDQDFVVASRALGVRNFRTIFRHILPNAMSPVLVAATFSVAAGILIESGLSFLGFGIQLPIPSWGSLFIESRSSEHWWIQIFPGLLIFLTVLLYNLLGEGVRDALDPRLKGAE